jgi:hypothetical protein
VIRLLRRRKSVWFGKPIDAAERTSEAVHFDMLSPLLFLLTSSQTVFDKHRRASGSESSPERMGLSATCPLFPQSNILLLPNEEEKEEHP